MFSQVDRWLGQWSGSDLSAGQQPMRRMVRVRLLSPATVQRVLAATSSFFEWAIAAEQYTLGENPIQRRIDYALGRVLERHKPFVGAASRQQPMRRMVRVRLPLRLPRPMGIEDVDALLASITTFA